MKEQQVQQEEAVQNMQVQALPREVVHRPAWLHSTEPEEFLAIEISYIQPFVYLV